MLRKHLLSAIRSASAGLKVGGWGNNQPVLHQVVHIGFHKLKDHEELVVLSNNLLQLDNVGMVQLLERLHTTSMGRGDALFVLHTLISRSPRHSSHV
jgi:hypothetical protein